MTANGPVPNLAACLRIAQIWSDLSQVETLGPHVHTLVPNLPLIPPLEKQMTQKTDDTNKYDERRVRWSDRSATWHYATIIIQNIQNKKLIVSSNNYMFCQR